MSDNDLPGMWSESDFLGGDPDERSYAQRVHDELVRKQCDDAIEALEALEALTESRRGPIGCDGFGPLYAHQISPEGTE